MNNALMLLTMFNDMINLCKDAPDQKMLQIKILAFDNLYKKCDVEQQGFYHELVLKGNKNDTV